MASLVLGAAAPALAQSEVHVAIDVIPASARYVIYAQLDPQPTRDPAFEEVWLPHCDEPLKVSRKSPKLDVPIYRAPAN